MPKIVVPYERRKVVSDAAVRIMARTGIEGASLRNLATETGLSIGAIRHYFESHDELMVSTMRELGRRIRHRVTTRSDRLLAADLTSPDVVADLLAELLPLGPEHREDMAAWLAFVAAARTQPAFQLVAEEHHEQTLRLIARILEEATDRGGLPAGLDLGIECFRLSALLDGLTLQAVLRPQAATSGLLMDVLRRNTRSLAAPSGS
ncbi:TetR/AcrR family transcriptional regulator [Lentzea albida]|uniref:TetR/AcrR family transcriptional regulator n=1 Tax=Lentzea albida TaxID=65499 RepID=UPI000B800A37|nr:TetR/AcrR family transcriptional regulator [Lentzea albida]